MEDRVGQQLGNYRLIRAIGEGGFAEVYLGEHIYLKTQAAIKVLKTRVVKDDMEGFLTEARTIANLIHPQIVRVLEFGVEGEIPFLVMDYAPNGTLRQRHPKGSRLPLPTVVSYVKQLASALQYAHEDRLIHRDVKQENMLLGRRNDVLLSDFGIALVAQSSRYQSTQDVVGTVAYMSPEQIQGKPRPASDQYSLGIVVYEWLTGDRPFRGSFTELCTQHMVATVPPLREKAPTILPAVEQVVTIALAKDYKQRFQSVQAFANALEQASRSERSEQSGQPKVVTLQASDQVVFSPPPAKPAEIPLLAPTQLPKPLSLPPTQLATPASRPQKELASALSSTEPPPLASASVSTTGEKLIPEPEKKVRVWSIGRRQIVAMIVGFILYGILIKSFISMPFGNLFLAIIIPIFLGTVFGPWVGLFTGIGVFINYVIGGSSAFRINEDIGFALIGLIAGLVLLITRGRYNTFRNIFIAEVFAVLATILGFGFALLTDGLPISLIWNAFTGLILTNIVYSLIALAILLLIYNAIVKAIRRRAS